MASGGSLRALRDDRTRTLALPLAATAQWRIAGQTVFVGAVLRRRRAQLDRSASATQSP
jgi:hypothetical protein